MDAGALHTAALVVCQHVSHKGDCCLYQIYAAIGGWQPREDLSTCAGVLSRSGVPSRIRRVMSFLKHSTKAKQVNALITRYDRKETVESLWQIKSLHHPSVSLNLKQKANRSKPSKSKICHRRLQARIPPNLRTDLP